MSARPNRTSDAPLLAWGEALRARKHRRAQLRRRILAVAVGAGIAVVLGSAAWPPAPRLLWNATSSAPIGLYSVSPGAIVGPGDMVIARVPVRFRAMAAERRYVPTNVPLVKRVAAAGGDEVCALGLQIFVEGRPIAVRRSVDGRGRPMPLWSGCIRLHGRQLFLLMDNPASFDGRYFGRTDGSDVVGKAHLLWRR
jgi:conjugative transfer signal peptidase TraF